MAQPRDKRQKVAVACDSCRTKKMKCDGVQPICQPCQKRAGTGARCTWKQGLARISNHLSSAEQIRWPSVGPRRSREAAISLDPNIRHHSGAISDDLNSQLPGGLQGSSSYSNQPATRFRPSTPPSESNAQIQGPSEPGFTELHRGQDSAHGSDKLCPSDHSVHAIIGATLDENGREGFFGSSCAGTFMQSVKKIVQQKVGGMLQSELAPSRGGLQTQNAPGLDHDTINYKPMDYVLPSRRRADTLLSTYWKYVHVLYPYLDKHQMQADYENLWKSNAPIADERSYLCLLNIVFALASQLDESVPMEERAQSANTFYGRAKELLDIIDTGSVRTVQSFLLLGQYVQSTNEPHPCWVFVGLAIRAAQSLGLNLPETIERVTDLRTREILRRVWHGCILMDRVVSMTYGRPCMVGPKAAIMVLLPSPIDPEEFTPGTLHGQPSLTRQPSTVDFYVCSLKLYDILHDVIFNFYSINSQQNQLMDAEMYFGSLSQGHPSVFEIERKLVKWEHDIPQHLKVSDEPQNAGIETIFHRQAIILHQRQLHVRLLLLRPVLSTFITSECHDWDRPVPLGSLLSHKVLLQSAIVCVRVALEAIDTVYKRRGNNVGQVGYLSAWWYNVLYLYTSATVLIAARLSSAILAEVSEESVLAGWHNAMEVLKEYSPSGAPIIRLTTTLRLLSEAVPQQYSRFRENSRHGQGGTSSVPQNQNQGTGPLPYWRPLNPVSFVSTPVDDLTRVQFDDISALPDDSVFGFDTVFDPHDLSWLMTIPMDS